MLVFAMTALGLPALGLDDAGLVVTVHEFGDRVVHGSLLRTFIVPQQVSNQKPKCPGPTDRPQVWLGWPRQVNWELAKMGG